MQRKKVELEDPRTLLSSTLHPFQAHYFNLAISEDDKDTSEVLELRSQII